MLKKKKNLIAIPLVLPIEEISLRPELSSPGGVAWAWHTNGVQTEEILVSYIG